MQAISGGRRTGKTWKLLQMYSRNPEQTAILVATEPERKRLTKSLVEDFNIPEELVHIFGPQEVGNVRVGSTVYVDNLAWFLEALLHMPINTVTYTGGHIHLGPSFMGYAERTYQLPE